MTELRISPEAADDLREIRKYITVRLSAPVTAQKLVSRILQSIRGLAEFPMSGQALSSVLNIETDYRFLVCKDYLIFYKVDQQTVFIVRVLHGKRDYLKLLFEEQPPQTPDN